MVQIHQMNDPQEVGMAAANIRGNFELFVKNTVEHNVIRVDCANAINRKKHIRLHRVYDALGSPQYVFVLTSVEAMILRSEQSPSIRAGNVIHYTGSWESIQLGWANKNLHETSRQPYVHDATLPQHRLNEDEVPRPLEDEYPVWYFLTGQIARPEKLQALWKLDKPPLKRSAHVHGLTTLLYGNDRATVESYKKNKNWDMDQSVGAAYLVVDRLAEERLRYFKTNHFKVIRCKIALHPIYKHGRTHEVSGLTFVPQHGKEVLDSVNNKLPTSEALNGTGGELVREPSVYLFGDREIGPEHDAAYIQEASLQDAAYRSYVFPILGDGRRRNASESLERRMLLRSPNRPRSPLVPGVSGPAPPSPPTSVTDTQDTPSVPEPDGLSGPTVSSSKASVSDEKSKAPQPWSSQP
jgi:hypothetical protein